MKSFLITVLAFILIACSKTTYVVGEITIFKDAKVITKDFTSCIRNTLCTVEDMAKVRRIGAFYCDLEGAVYIVQFDSGPLKQSSLKCSLRTYTTTERP